MILKRVTPSMTVLELADGGAILFSYETPAACRIGRTTWHGYPAGALLRSDKYISRTTAGHVQAWLQGQGQARAIPHDQLLKFCTEAR